ncbi:unnamed protein product, partial [Phaeothamnion confervicola]
LLVHGIDAARLREEESQEALAVLASCRSVHMIATADHVNAGLLWDSGLRQRMALVWVHAPTYEPYAAEAPAALSAFPHFPAFFFSRGTAAFRPSFSPHARLRQLELLQAVARYQVQHPDALGLGRPQLLAACRGYQLAVNEAQVDDIVAELAEHRMMAVRRRGPAGERFLHVPRAQAAINEVLHYRRAR